jgi:cell division protein FtsQ
MAKINKKKMLLFLLWSLIGTVVVVLSVQAMSKQEEKICSGYTIDIAGGGDHFFIDKNDVLAILNNNGSKVIRGRSLKSFDLRAMENKMERNPWIRDAQLFFDNNGQLNVVITEAEPIARIFTVTGNSFYIDTAMERLPLSNKLSARLPVFTGFPTDKPRLNAADSALMSDIKMMSRFMLKEPLWMAQIAQVDITPERKFEMIPTIGRHVIEFGNGQDYEKKFRRLLIFYKDVLSKTGMDTYSRINVQFNRQVIGVRGGSTAPVLMPLPLPVRDSSFSRSTSVASAAKANPANTEKPPIDSRPAANRKKQSGAKKNPPSKSQSYETPAKPLSSKAISTDTKPKAVMPKRNSH